MDISRLKETDLFGRFFLKAADGDRSHVYYRSLDALRPLLRSQQWFESITGFYINVGGDFNAVRLSYFTSTPDRAKEVVNRFGGEHEIEYLKTPSPPVQTRISDTYGGEELRFRKYLSSYSLVGLDIMEADLLYARCLFATFRWQIMISRKPYKPHFLWTFENHSPFYMSLTPRERDQFWLDLVYWPNLPQVDWVHLFVNMVLGCDWISPKGWRFSLTPHEPLPITKINDLVQEFGFQISQDWQPVKT